MAPEDRYIRLGRFQVLVADGSARLDDILRGRDTLPLVAFVKEILLMGT